MGANLIFVQDAVNHMEEMEMATSTSPAEKTKHKPLVPSNDEVAMPAASNLCANATLRSPTDGPPKVEKNGHTVDNPKAAKIFEIQTMPNGKTRTSLKTMSRRKFSQQKEKKATQMLAIVLGKGSMSLPPPVYRSSPSIQEPPSTESDSKLGASGTFYLCSMYLYQSL